MNTSNWIVLIGVVLGSNVLVAVLYLLRDRFRFDRRTDVVKSWQDESNIEDDLKLRAAESLGRGDHVSAARYTAKAHAIQVNLDRRIAASIVPADTRGTLFYFGSFAVYILAGWILLYSAISKSIDSGGSIVLGTAGAILIGVAILLFWLGSTHRSDRSVARRLVFDTLNQDSGLPESKIFSFNGDLVEVLGGRMGLGFRRSLFGVDTALDLETFLNRIHEQRKGF